MAALRRTLIRGLARAVRRVARPRPGRARCCCTRGAHQDGVGGGIAQQAGHFGLLARQCLVGGCIVGGRAGSSGERIEEERERRQSGGQRRQRRRDARAAALTAQTGPRGHRSRQRSERCGRQGAHRCAPVRLYCHLCVQKCVFSTSLDTSTACADSDYLSLPGHVTVRQRLRSNPSCPLRRARARAREGRPCHSETQPIDSNPVSVQKQNCSHSVVEVPTR